METKSEEGRFQSPAPTQENSNQKNGAALCPAQKSALVLGAGIIGLTTAIRLLERRFNVLILAKETPTSIFRRDATSLKGSPPGTYTSSGSGGYWMPFHSEGPNFEAWCATTYRVLEAEAAGPYCGVTMHDGLILRATHFPDPLPWYADLASVARTLPADDPRIPPGYCGALRMRAPIAVMDDYLPALEARALAAGARVELSRALTRPAALATARARLGPSAALVNCTGVGARVFSGDGRVAPGRGVTLRVRCPPGARHFVTEDDADGVLSRDGLLAYCLPRGREYTLGGTLFRGDWREDADPEEEAALLARCAKLLPAVARAEVTGRWTGLRPLRDGGARVEVESEAGADGAPVVANYGHGGSGVTCCWGAADEAAALVERVVAGLA